MNYEEEEKFEQKQIALYIRNSKHCTSPSDAEEEILLKTKPYPSHLNNSNPHQHEFDFQDIEYKLNHVEDEIIVAPQIIDLRIRNNFLLCLIWKYRSEFILTHRKQRYNIIFTPIYIMFIVFFIFICLSINDRMNSNTISYINDPINAQFRKDATQSELENVKMCDISLHHINGWFDAESFDILNNKWMDYSVYKNDIDSSSIFNEIKLGLFYKHNNSKLYVYGSKFDSINMPTSLKLNKNNYTIITVARYNGND
eukprot:489678_1